jgi:hypothetical protein
MRIIIGIIAVLIFAHHSFSQSNEFNGRLEDLQTHQPLPYATVQLFSQKTGTIANVHGEFKLVIRYSNAEIDSLEFSCLGYFKCKISVGDFIKMPDKIISMKEVHYLLSDVVVVPKKYKTITLGITDNKPESKQISNIFNSKIGNFIKNKKNQTGWIRSVSFYLDKEGHPETPFRVRIFFVNKEKNCPGEDILNENLIVSAPKPGWLTVDLTNYHLQFPPEGAFVAMEWINAGDNYFYERETTKKEENGAISKEMRKFYGQAIGSILKQPEMLTWGNRLGNEWIPFTPFYKGYINAMIHAEIAYPVE